MSSSPYFDLTRPPLRADSLNRALVRPGAVWTEVQVIRETGSTNADLADAARAGAAGGRVLLAERQTAGRGRLERSWQAPAQSAITMSVLLRPPANLPPVRLGWLPLLTGVAVAEVIGRLGQVDAVLKWPNDVLVRSVNPEADQPNGEDEPYGKCAGILAERAGDAVVVGIGLNVAQRADELPPPADPTAYPPTSLALVASACTDRDPLVRAILRALADWYDQFIAAEGDPEASGLLPAYRERSHTIGRTVAVALPGGDTISGVATDVDIDGRLAIDTAEGVRMLAAGDVLRVR